MKRLQAFKFQLITTPSKEKKLLRYVGCSRFVYNKALTAQIERIEKGESRNGFASLCKTLTDWRHSEENSFLAEAPTHPLQQSLKDLERAFVNFRAGRAGFPRFKKRGSGDAIRYPDAKQIRLDEKNNRIFLPKLGWTRYRNSRAVQGEGKNVTVKISNGKWFMSIQTEREVEEPLATGRPVGIDVGIVRFATLSDGSVIEPLNSFRKHEAVLKKAQRKLSRKRKFSKNWRKARALVQRIHARIANVHKDFLHRQSTTICKSHAIVCVEKLQVGNMSRSAAGSMEEPGKNVRAKSGLNKSILDQGWYEFRRQLEYKLTWKGGLLVTVPPQNTSRTCPACSCVAAENRLSQAEFRCKDCGFEENADKVGAINILRAGLAQLACQANEDTRRQQEPSVSAVLTA
jgi:putative transposase